MTDHVLEWLRVRAVPTPSCQDTQLQYMLIDTTNRLVKLKDLAVIRENQEKGMPLLQKHFIAHQYYTVCPSSLPSSSAEKLLQMEISEL